MKLLSISFATLLNPITTFALAAEPSKTTNRSRILDLVENGVTERTSRGPAAVHGTQNWSGGVATNVAFYSVHVDMTIPELRLPEGGDPSTLYGLSAWVGIDGTDYCPSDMLQTGVDMYLKNGVATYIPWFQWYPGNHMYLRDTIITAGDTVRLSVGTSPRDMSRYFFTVSNYRTGGESRMETNNTHVLLCGFTTEFIVEDFWNTDRLPLVDFGNIKFTSTISEVEGGIAGGMEGLKLLEVEEEGTERKPIHCTNDGVTLSCDYQTSN
ncbi:peptidase A4 family-domain-containing protein [Dichotomopilus funicola]|uniref:Peptidase A4 family-domain-containing protein n=1 Tax=Dichotomopilus funicola TaxID=1934379 RepID=A0AAN6V6E1_9PEZI|nr:peptidase A4 family-domain-containing protein [Dichotomopilus funicola]